MTLLAPTSSDYVIISDAVFDSETQRLSSKRIEVSGGFFVSVEPWTDASVPSDGEVFDLRGYTVAPPLVDPHVHAYMEPWPLNPEVRRLPGSGDFKDELRAARKRLEEAHLAGVGVVRDLGDPIGINAAIAEEAVSNSALPRMICAGSAVYREGRYGRFIGKGVSSSEGLYRAVRRLVDEPGTDLVKLIVTGIVNFEKGTVSGKPQFSVEELRLAVRTAHEHGRMVAAHCSGDAGVRYAAEAGIDFIEHGFFVESATIELIGEKGLVWTPTLAPVHAQWNHAECCGWGEKATANLRVILDKHLEAIRYAHKTGVNIMPGSDAGSPGVPHGGGLIRELELMATAGISARELLAMATTRAPCWIRGEKVTGRIAPGMAADFIAVKGDPTANIADLRNIEFVARSGVVRHGRRAVMESDVDAETYGLGDSMHAAVER